MIDRVALFVTCLADTLFPEVGKATVTVLERLGIEVVFPAEQTCCGQMHANSGYPAEAELLARRFVEIFEPFEAVVTPSGSCAAQVREHYPGAARRRRPRRAGADVGALAVPHRRARGRGRRLGLRGHGRLPPDVPFAAAAARRRRAAAAAARGARASSSSSFPDAEECCGFGGTFAVKNADVSAAMLDEKLAAIARLRRGERLRLRQLVPDAHRRRAAPPRLERAAGAPRRDPRLVSERESEASRRRARPESFPQAAPAALAESRRCGRTSATRRRSIRASAPAVVAEVPDWELLRAAAAAIKDETLARLDEVLVELEASVQAAGGVVHWARDAAEANEIVTALVRAEGADEVVKVKSLATDEIRLNEALEGAGIRPIETDLAELIIQLADERPSHLLVPAIHKNRAEIRDLFRDAARAARPLRRARPSSPRRRGSICARRSCARGSRSRARTSPPPTPARSASSSRRATAACARRCRRC